MPAQTSAPSRLLHTETSFINEQASRPEYKEDGIEQYAWDATLDLKTCEKCGELDGKMFDVADEVAGKNAPPAHGFCSCTTVPHFGDEDEWLEGRAARDPFIGRASKYQGT